MLSTLVVDSLALMNNSPYMVETIDGIEHPDIRQSSYNKPGEHGAVVNSELYGTRPITINGDIMATDTTSYMLARRNLAYACRIQRDTYGFPLPTSITFTSLDGSNYFINGYIKSFKMSSPYPTYTTFQIVFTCSDPAIYAQTLQTSGLITMQTGGGVVFPLIFPITFSGGNPGTGTVANYGNLDTWPVIYLRGPLTNPRLYSYERQTAFQLNYTTTNATDIVIIDMLNKTVMLNGTTNLLQYRSSDSNWFSLKAATSNTVLLTTGSTSDTGTMEVTAYPAFLTI